MSNDRSCLDAVDLFDILWDIHGDTEFPLVYAKGAVEGLAWSARRFRNARDVLLDRGLLVCVREPVKRHKWPALYVINERPGALAELMAAPQAAGRT